MKKNVFSILVLGIIAFTVLLSSGCTQQTREKNFGGTAIENLAKGRKLVNVTWKDNNLWLLTRPMLATDAVETYEFREASSFGLLQGKVVINESR